MLVSLNNILRSPLPKAFLSLPLEGIIFTCSEEESLHVLITHAKKPERPKFFGAWIPESLNLLAAPFQGALR